MKSRQKKFLRILQKLKETENPLDISTDKSLDKMVYSNEEIISSKCKKGFVTNGQYEDLQEKIKNEFHNKTSSNGEKKIIIAYFNISEFHVIEELFMK